ncbi:MAG: 30S ribosomal protein S6 [Pirellulales bacterium]
MAENVYEGLFILDANRYAHDQAGVSGRVNALIEKHGGTILVSRLWEERRLAYPIRGQKKGAYWLTYFRTEGSKIGPLTEEAMREANFLRQMFLKIDPRIVDTLVSHALQRKEARPATARPGARTGAPTAGPKDAGPKDAGADSAEEAAADEAKAAEATVE